jgi:hypothetical protein
MYAQFNDADMSMVIGIFYSEQSSEEVPYQSEIEPSDPRYAAWWNALPSGTILTGLEPPSK